MNATTCRCGKPTRDAAYVCDDCATALSVALGDVPWLEEELDTTITRSKGVDYRTRGGTRATERPSPVAWNASDARTNLRGFLIAWTRYCHEENIRNSSPIAGMPAGDMPTMTALSRYLMWRVDGLTLSDFGSAAVDEITDAVKKCHRLIDTPTPKQYLGDCRACGMGRLYAKQGSAWAVCNTCADSVPADDVRSKVLASLDDRLCTADEIGELSTYFGLKADREQVRKHVEYLGRKDRIVRHGPTDETARYRFGEVYEHLIAKDYGKVS